MTRSFRLARITAGLVVVAALASCNQGAVVSATVTKQPTNQQLQLSSDGTIPACRADLVTFTTRALVLGSPHTTAVDITLALTNRGKFACALPQPQTVCFADPTAEVTTTDGRLVWNPRYLDPPCPARPPGEAPILVHPGQSLVTTQTWNLTICRPDGGCFVPKPAGGATQARVAPGRYVARGTSDTVGNARGATLTIL